MDTLTRRDFVMGSTAAGIEPVLWPQLAGYLIESGNPKLSGYVAAVMSRVDYLIAPA